MPTCWSPDAPATPLRCSSSPGTWMRENSFFSRAHHNSTHCVLQRHECKATSHSLSRRVHSRATHSSPLESASARHAMALSCRQPARYHGSFSPASSTRTCWTAHGRVRVHRAQAATAPRGQLTSYLLFVCQFMVRGVWVVLAPGSASSERTVDAPLPTVVRVVVYPRQVPSAYALCSAPQRQAEPRGLCGRGQFSKVLGLCFSKIRVADRKFHSARIGALVYIISLTACAAHLLPRPEQALLHAISSGLCRMLHLCALASGQGQALAFTRVHSRSRNHPLSERKEFTKSPAE